MRHSDINLTMLRYTHTFRGQTQSALEQLPDLSLPSTEAQQARATGTDERSTAGEGAYKPAYKKLTKTADFSGQGSSLVGNEAKSPVRCADNPEPASKGMLDTSCPMLAKDGSTEQEGFEPPVPFGTVVFKTTASNPQVPEKKELTDSQEASLQASLQTYSENGQNQALSLPSDLAEIVAVWPKLPEHIKAAVMALVKANGQG